MVGTIPPPALTLMIDLSETLEIVPPYFPVKAKGLMFTFFSLRKTFPSLISGKISWGILTYS
jgi:hypothetical protein